MNTPIDTHDADVLKTGTLQKKGGEYTLVLLSAQHIDQILALQDIVVDSLSDEEKNFVVKKDKAFFENHFNEDNDVLGVLHNGTLIAQSVIVNPTAKNPKTGMVDMALKTKVDKMTIIQGVLVHPDYRGNRLMTIMVDAWLDIAQKQHRTNAIAEVAVDNFYSLLVFLKEGLHIHSMGVDPSDGTHVYNIHAHVTPLIQRRLSPTFNAQSAQKTVSCPHDDLEKQKELLASGYKGVGFNAANDTVEFKAKKCAHKPK